MAGALVVLSRLEGLANRVTLLASQFAALVLLALVLLTVVDVVGRYIFTMPVVGAVELVRIAMAAIIFLSFPLMFFANDHVIVDLIPFMKRRLVRWVSTCGVLAIIGYIGFFLGSRVFAYATRAYEDGDVTEYLSIPRFYVVGFIAVMIWGSTVLALLRLTIMLGKTGKIDSESTDQS